MVIAKIRKLAVASAAEAEVVSLYHAVQEIVPLWVKVEEIGHKEPTTPLRIDDNTMRGFMKGAIRQRRSKAIDIQFFG